MKKTLLSFLLLLNYFNGHTQVKVGLKSDLNGIPFNGYYDALLYTPTNKIIKNHNSDSFEIGSFVDESGKEISGLIKFGGKKIWFNQDGKLHKDKIKPDEIQKFEIGVDSFFAISKYNWKNSVKTKPTYVQYITKFKNYTVVKHYKIVQASITESYFIKSIDSDTWESFPKKKNMAFRMKALPYFRHVPYLDFKISTSQYKEDDLLSIVKMAEYYEKHQNSEAIFYDKYWQEVRDEKHSEYKALISSQKDTIWTFDYFNKDNIKIYQANYSQFYPNIKNGDFTAYYPDGRVRKIVSFLEDKAQEVKEFTTSGMLSQHYKIIDNNSKGSSKEPISIRYLIVNDSLGNNILSNKSTARIIKKDPLNNENYTHIYKKDELVSVYKLVDGKKVHQITDTEYDYKIKSIQGKFSSFMNDKKYNVALSENAQGTLLVSFIIDDNGFVIESTVFNNIHPEIDAHVKDFVASKLLPEANSRISFKPFKKDNEKSYCEVIVPFEFNTNRFYRQPPNFNQQFHFQMMHNQMINHAQSTFPKSF